MPIRTARIMPSTTARNVPSSLLGQPWVTLPSITGSKETSPPVLDAKSVPRTVPAQTVLLASDVDGVG